MLGHDNVFDLKIYSNTTNTLDKIWLPLVITVPQAAPRGGGQGGHGPPQRPDKNDKNGPICSILHYQKKKFQGGMPLDPPNSRIWSVFLALAASGPRQCERLEPPVISKYTLQVLLFVSIAQCRTGAGADYSIAGWEWGRKVFLHRNPFPPCRFTPISLKLCA